jgi:hypothetical protein
MPTHLHLLPRLRLSGAISPFPLYTCMACMGTTSSLLFPVCKIATAVCASTAVHFLCVMQILIHGFFYCISKFQFLNQSVLCSLKFQLLYITKLARESSSGKKKIYIYKYTPCKFITREKVK